MLHLRKLKAFEAKIIKTKVASVEMKITFETLSNTEKLFFFSPSEMLEMKFHKTSTESLFSDSKP